MLVRFVTDSDDFRRGQVVEIRREEALAYVRDGVAEPAGPERAVRDLEGVERR